ncbi:MAG: hypothetical protein JNK24_02990 [Alphaproteobacteria bacterium]|nr:hypothetical protein [Alphaproteobacteria bacterium]
MKLILARLSTLLVLMMVIVSGSSLFWVSQKVQQLERQQKSLTAQIAEEKEGIRVLTAEWDYLNRPERLERLSQAYLGLQELTPDQLLNHANYIPLKQDVAHSETPAMNVSAQIGNGSTRQTIGANARNDHRSNDRSKKGGTVGHTQTPARKIYDIQSKPIRENGVAAASQNFNRILETERDAQ